MKCTPSHCVTSHHQMREKTKIKLRKPDNTGRLTHNNKHNVCHLFLIKMNQSKAFLASVFSSYSTSAIPVTFLFQNKFKLSDILFICFLELNEKIHTSVRSAC